MTVLSFWDQVVDAAKVMTWVEITAVITGILYVILAARENIWCWFWGIISSILSIYFFYTQLNLYAEAFLYAYYVVAGVYGWYAWRKNAKEKQEGVLGQSDNENTLSISVLPIHRHLALLGLGIALSFLLAYFLKTYTSASVPLVDSFTTIFSFIATYLVTRKVLENWIYWIVIDLVSTGLYFNRGAYLYALMMIVYTIIAYIGYQSWKAVYKEKAKAF